MNLAEVLLERETGSGAVLRDGIVSTVSPLTIIVPPSTVASPATALDSYYPQVGDFVQVLVQGANRLVIGAAGGTVSGTYTPTLNGIVEGTGGQNTAQFTYTGGLLYVEGTIGFGTSGQTFPLDTSTVRLPPGFLLIDPVLRRPCGNVIFFDVGSAAYPGVCWHHDLDEIRLLVVNTASTYAAAGGTLSTIPFTWIAGDQIYYSFTVRASRA